MKTEEQIKAELECIANEMEKAKQKGQITLALGKAYQIAIINWIIKDEITPQPPTPPKCR